MQGVIKAYDPASGDGVIMCDSDLADYELAPGALDGSIFRMLRQGQRVLFEVDGGGRATKLRLGSERDMETPVQLAANQTMLHSENGLPSGLRSCNPTTCIGATVAKKNTTISAKTLFSLAHLPNSMKASDPIHIGHTQTLPTLRA